jgi:hypothetical protein
MPRKAAKDTSSPSAEKPKRRAQGVGNATRTKKPKRTNAADAYGTTTEGARSVAKEVSTEERATLAARQPHPENAAAANDALVSANVPAALASGVVMTV